MASSIRTTLIRRVTIILVISFIAVLSIVAIMTIYTANTNLKNSEQQLFQALVTKGNTLVVNNSQALIEMVSDNSFSAIHNLVSATVNNDNDIVYGVFMDTSMQPWTIINQPSAEKNGAQYPVLNDPLSLWAGNLAQSGYIKIDSNSLPPYYADNHKTVIYEFAAPVFGASEQEIEANTDKSTPNQLLGTIRYGISTYQLENARTKAKFFTLNIMLMTLFIIFLLGCMAVFFSYMATRYTATLISQPLAELSQATVDISQGNYNTPIIIKSDNEVGILSKSFDTMRLKIKEALEQLLLHQKDLKDKNKRLKITQDELTNLNQHLEDKVNERTKELKVVQDKLVKTARAAGMAEIAINVLHNIGNVINSVNVANQDNYAMLKRSRISGITKTSELIEQHRTNMGQFINNDPKGKKLPELLKKLGIALNKEHQALLENSKRMNQSIGVIGNIIATQQKLAKSSLYIEKLDFQSIINEILDIQKNSFESHSIQVITHFKEVPPLSADQAKLHQILTNLIVNAKHALLGNSKDNRILDIKLFADLKFFIFTIKDNGSGILKESITDIFQHGFTTKSNGHGFGLHSCANLIGEMGGKINAQSDGLGKGASFIVKLPINNQFFDESIVN